MSQVPTVGRIVLYQMASGKSRPAIVVEPWTDSQPDPSWKGKVNLLVFLDGDNDRSENGGLPVVNPVQWRGSVEHDEAGTKPNTWKWPSRA